MDKFIKVAEDSSINVEETKDWYAWLDTMPPNPNGFHVTGSILVPHPGVKASLKDSVPQGFNPKILLLDLIVEAIPGYWPAVMTWINVRRDEVFEGNGYDSIQIFLKGQSIGGADVEIIS